MAEDQSFYLTFVFDAYGNDATLGNTVIGSDTTTLRKTAAEVIRNCGLTRMVDANMGTTIDAGHNTMFRLEMPKNHLLHLQTGGTESGTERSVYLL